MRPPAAPRRDGLIVAALILWPFVYFWRATLGWVAMLPHDGYRLIYPQKLLAAQALSHGELLLWSPYIFAGFPLFAAMQPGTLHPGVWLFCLLPPMMAANLQMILTASAAAVGTYGYTRRIGCRRSAAAFAGVTFALGGFMVAHVGHFQMPQGMVVLPWLLWGFDALRSALRLRVVAGVAAALACGLLAGYAPGLVYVLMVCAAYVLAAAYCERTPVGRLRYLAACAAAVGLGVLLAAVQLLPMLELAAQSLRSTMTFERYGEYSLTVTQLPILVFPFLFGGDLPRPYWGRWNIIEMSGYVGIAPLMLAVAALALVRRNWRAAFWLAVAVVALLLALGNETPLASIMYRVPVYNLLRAQARNLFELDFALAVLSAMALSAAPRRALRTGAVVTGVTVVVMGAAALLARDSLWLPLATLTSGPATAREVIDALPSAHAVWVPLAFALAGMAALLALARRRSALSLAVVLAVQLADLGYFGTMIGQMYPDIPWVLSPPEIVTAMDGLPLDRAAERVAILSNDVEAVDLRPQLWGVRMVNGYDSMPLARYAAFAGDMVYSGQVPPARAFAEPLFLDLLSARWVVVRHPPYAPADAELATALADTSRWTMRRQTPKYTVLENLRARPRAWLVERTAAVDAAMALVAVRHGRLPDGAAFDPSQVAIVEEAPARQYAGGGAVTVASDTPAAIELVTKTPAAAFLVVSEVHYAGWRAYVDGAEVPLVRTDAVLRGVEVGPGVHRVRMEFAPRSLRLGLLVSVLTGAGLLAAALMAARSRRRGIRPERVPVAARPAAASVRVAEGA